MHVPIVVEKNNDLPYKYQSPEQSLVNAEIPVQVVVEPASIEPLRRSQLERRSATDDYEVYLQELDYYIGQVTDSQLKQNHVKT